MSDPINIILVNLPPIEFTQAKSMRERAVEIYRDHLDHQEWRMDGARLGMAADIIEAQAKAIERVRALIQPDGENYWLIDGCPEKLGGPDVGEWVRSDDILAALEGKTA